MVTSKLFYFLGKILVILDLCFRKFVQKLCENFWIKKQGKHYFPSLLYVFKGQQDYDWIVK